MNYKLNWQVDRDEAGAFIRRSIDRDSFHLSYIDINWLYDGDFPEDYVYVPDSHPPEIRYKKVSVGRRKIIRDQISVKAETPDSTIAMILDEKRLILAKTLNIEP